MPEDINFPQSTDQEIRGHHIKSFDVDQDLLRMGYRLTKEGIRINGNLVRGNTDLEDHLKTDIKQSKIKSNKIYQDLRKTFYKDKPYEWAGQKIDYVTDTYEYHHEPENLVERLMSRVRPNHIPERHRASEQFINNAALNARTDVMYQIYNAPPDEVVSLNIFPDDICAGCPIGMHCLQDENIYKDDVQAIGDYINYCREKNIPLQMIAYIEKNGDAQPVEAVTTMGDLRQFFLDSRNYWTLPQD